MAISCLRTYSTQYPWLVQPAFLQLAEVAWRRSRPACDLGGRPDHRRDVFKVGEGLDDGPIVASLTIELTGRETSGELLDRLAEEGAPMYVDALAAVGEGTATFTAQPAEGLEYAHKITVEDARISWTDEAEAIDRQVRACTPHPGAWTELFAEGPIADNDEPAAKPLTLHILAAQPADQSNPNTPPSFSRRAEGGQEERVGWYRQHAAGTHPSQGAGQEGHARRRLGPRRAPLPRRCVR